MLSFGRLCLNGGVFDEQRIVSEKYLREAAAPSNANTGYGYLFWLGENWYACRGYGGQRIHICPEKQLICVIQATPSPRGMAYDDVIRHMTELL